MVKATKTLWGQGGALSSLRGLLGGRAELVRWPPHYTAILPMPPIEHLATSPSCEYHPHPIPPPWQVIDTAKLEGKFFKPEARQRRDSQGEIITSAVLAPRSSKVELLEPKRPPPPPPLGAPSPHYTPYGTPHSLP